ncbi:DNA primase (bacterial type) [Phaeobacter sp. CECT 5382]|uniref:hypothetical protein n=1 Tax=Phaeobacter sp. CECT 5382 TaxID=1712645 RepID=UPI0006DB4F91|nr:hypothetical protein [Phaeobacter sp. CECT 5382]CUH88851.1 DNA primase (bacterial type) [Phaeobacter sp. CECT 5382]
MNTLQDLRHPSAGRADTRHIYTDTTGAPMLVANRYEGNGKGKFFLPYDVTKDAWKAPLSRPIYHLDRIAQAQPDQPVIWVEGEKCADALAALGYLTSTSFGGSKALAKTDLSPLAGRTVIIWPDHDEPGHAYAAKLAEDLVTLHSATPLILPITEGLVKEHDQTGIIPNYLPKGWDVADAIAAGWGNGEIDALVNKTFCNLPDATAVYLTKRTEPAANDTQPPLTKRTGDTAAQVDDLELWKNPQGEPYVTLRRKGHLENWATGSKVFRDYLAYAHYKTEGKAPSNATLDDKRRMLEGMARFEGETHPVFSRVASIGRTLYLDLGDDDWQSVAITSEGWQVVSHSPARFRRSPAMQGLPKPERHPDGINLLREFLNVGSEDDFRMLVAWVLGCFHPKGPYPILILSGEQGSAKSTTAQTLRDLIDPAQPSTRSTPNSEQDLVIAAMHNHVLSFDNLSTVRPAMADAFCRIATGGGFGTRKLHSDSDEVLFNATRPCLLNGIPDLAARPDLADRSIGIHLPVIPAAKRKTLGAFNRDFAKAKPFILGALLDAVSCALGRIDSVSLSEAPRMADFAKWVVAAEPSLGWTQGAFLDSYGANRSRSDQAAIEGNPVALAILSLLDGRTHWSGTATDLRQTLRERFPAMTEDSQSFPRSDARFGAALRRVQPVLRRQGLNISFNRTGKAGMRMIELTNS